MPPFQPGGPAYRIRRGEQVAYDPVDLYPSAALGTHAFAELIYDDGEEDTLNFPEVLLGASSFQYVESTNRAKKDGWVVRFIVTTDTDSGIFPGSLYIEAYITGTYGLFRANHKQFIACGYVEQGRALILGVFEPQTCRATWVFQGTVAEDATAGTHVCTLTVTPGAGNEMQVQYGFIIVGNTATAQTATVEIDDGTNLLTRVLNPALGSTTTALNVFAFPTTGNFASNPQHNQPSFSPFPVSGTMRLVLKVTTTAVSVTQTFSLVCKIRGGIPTATLADTVGTPTLTTNRNAVF